MAHTQTKSQSKSQGLSGFSVTDPQALDTELILVSALKVESVKENPDLLFEAVSLSRFVVIEGKKKIMVRTEDIEFVEITETVTFHLKSGKTVEAE